MRNLIVFIAIAILIPLSPAHANDGNGWETKAKWLYTFDTIKVSARQNTESGSSSETLDLPASNSGGGVLVVSPGPSVGELVVGYQRMLGLMAYDSCAAIDVDRPTAIFHQHHQTAAIPI